MGIVDATEFSELYEQEIYGPFFREQVSLADVVLVNKVDLADEKRTSEAVKLVEQINPSAVVFRTERAKIDAELPSSSGRRAVPQGRGHVLEFDTLCLRVEEAVPLERARAFFGQCGEGAFGDVVRAKALLVTEEGPYRFDLSFGSVEESPFTGGLTGGRLVVFGRALRKDEMAGSLRGPKS